jgi:hypothetical protein
VRRRSTLLLATLCMLAPFTTHGASAAHAPCVRAAYHAVARSDQGVVLEPRGDRGEALACWFRRDKLAELADPVDDYVSHITMTGRYVAFFDHFEDGADPGFVTMNFSVFDIRRRELVFLDRTTEYPSNPLALPVVIRLKRNGSVAWSTCPWHESAGSFGEPLRCDSAKADTRFQIVAHSSFSADRTHSQILDSGPGIDVRSLRLRGSELSWTDGGELRRASLR